ncbi:NAD(P)/FAD-dependent oxidoreductase [Caenimonas aquaedulcis]|uniref:FAD-dependent oxidoreductase n=1 Tax=Caenimonas aquaedulcis TaxID=2793270 RepID=A0A931H3R4_9BURK|nr:FAD-dependent oxidoreductase [Caenimonas aquaedulcis]MBG9388019.1 FAD-dependent oxidoreductase [Caenimonas aquaedulcis]
METSDKSLLIVGAGHAGSELAISARQGGWAGPITLLGEEPGVPYHRPPLSKAYLAGEADLESILLRPAAAYENARVERITGVRMTAIDRAARQVRLEDGRSLHYDKLALCLGGRPRPLVCEGMPAGAPPANLLYLRTLQDAGAIGRHLGEGKRLVIVGGGYVGLEVAASASKQGVHVTVLEAQPRVLARVAGPRLSQFYESVHREHGVEILTGVQVARVRCEGADITAIECTDGRVVEADCVVAGIGMLANVDVPMAAGLATAEGIEVDEHGATSDPDIFAAGDCTRYLHPLYGREVRIESVPNALEQARAIAGWLCGKPKPNRAVPWFWSDQYELKLQMAGLAHGHDRCVLRGEPASRSFCAFYLQGDRLLAIDAVNRPAEFMAVRRALVRPLVVDAERLADEAVPLKDQLA